MGNSRTSRGLITVMTVCAARVATLLLPKISSTSITKRYYIAILRTLVNVVYSFVLIAFAMIAIIPLASVDLRKRIVANIVPTAYAPGNIL